MRSIVAKIKKLLVQSNLFLKEHRWLVYVLTIGVLSFVTWGIGDANLIKQIGYSRKISRLERELEKAQATYRSDSTKLQELSSDPENLERIARIQYQMKAPEEVIFLLVDSTQTKNN